MGTYIDLCILILLLSKGIDRVAHASECGVRKILPTSRIIGGDTSFPNSWPWMVYIELGPATHKCPSLCGGTLISPQWVLTAAHCLYTPEDCIEQRKWKLSEFAVYFGVHDRQKLSGAVKRDVIEAIFHNSYHFPNHDGDVALLKLSTPVQYSDKISPLCLATLPGMVTDGAQCMVTGWGLTDTWSRVPSRYLMEVGVKYSSAATCRAKSNYNSAQITDTMICAEDQDKDSCSGDSGGPLLCPFPTSAGNVWKQIGIVSWGKGCALRNYPGVYVDVSVFYQWIKSKTNMVADCKQYGCEQYCSQTNILFPPVCYCKLGYNLQSDGKGCQDINECTGSHGCSDLCVNTPGGYKCECYSGRTLSNDQRTCAENQRFVCPRPYRPLHGFNTCQQDRYVAGATCEQTCVSQGFVFEGVTQMECMPNGVWSTPVAKCRDVNECSVNNGGCEHTCYNSPGGFSCGCNSGFELQNNGKNCKDITPPIFLSCPSDIDTITLPGENYNSVNFESIRFLDNVNARLVSGPEEKSKDFEIGAHKVKYVITDDAGNTAECSFVVFVKDVEKPEIKNCPTSVNKIVDSSIETVVVPWDDLNITDNSGQYTVNTNAPVDHKFSVGSHRVIYTAVDPSGNWRDCEFDVNIEVSTGIECPALQTSANAVLNCSKAAGFDFCFLQCKTGYRIPEGGIYMYVCSRQGTWNPSNTVPVCVSVN